MKKRIKFKYMMIVLLLISILTFDIANDINEVDQIGAENLVSEDFELSLEGYGAREALVDKAMSIGDMLM